MMPMSLPFSITPAAPKLSRLMAFSVSGTERSGAISGSCSPTRIRSRTRFNAAPSLPPGWMAPKWSLLKPRAFRSATANASPSARHMVVEMVGAGASSLASPQSGITKAAVEARASVELDLKVMPMIGTLKRWQ